MIGPIENVIECDLAQRASRGGAPIDIEYIENTQTSRKPELW